MAASYEQRVNASAMKRLANASARLVGSFDDFPVLFEHGYVDAATGVGATRPMVTAADADVASVVAHESSIAVSGASSGNGTYDVVDTQPDGAGFTVLMLEVA